MNGELMQSVYVYALESISFWDEFVKINKLMWWHQLKIEIHTQISNRLIELFFYLAIFSSRSERTEKLHWNIKKITFRIFIGLAQHELKSDVI